MATSVLQTTFASRRTGANRIREASLILIFIVAVLPFLACMSLWLSRWSRILLVRLLGSMGKTLGGDALVCAAMLVVVMLALAFLRTALSPDRFASRMHGRELSQQEAPARDLVTKLARIAGIPPPHLQAVDGTGGLNALSFGLAPATAQIFVTSGMFELFGARELEGVLAHEIAHIANGETRLNSLAAALLFFLKLPAVALARLMRAWARFRGRLQRRGDHEVYYMRFWLFRIPLGSFRAGTSISLFWMLLTYIYFGRWTVPSGVARGSSLQAHALRLLVTLLPFFMLVVAPLLANFVRPILAKGRDLEADADAVLLTGSAEGLLRALTKIQTAGLATAGANPILSHLYFVDPRGGIEAQMPSGNLFGSRPGLAARIEHLQRMGGALSTSMLDQAQLTANMFADRHYRSGTTPEATGAMVDELAFAPPAHTAGRTFRLLAPAQVYELPDLNSRRLESVTAGSLMIGMEFTGNFRQVITSSQNFGYIPRSVHVQELQGLAMDAFEKGSAAAEGIPVPPPPHPGLSRDQKIVVIAFAAAVFVAVLAILAR